MKRARNHEFLFRIEIKYDPLVRRTKEGLFY